MILVVIEGVRIPATEFYCAGCQAWYSTVQTHGYLVRKFNQENRLTRRVRTTSNELTRG